jgi:hypothetical protein
MPPAGLFRDHPVEPGQAIGFLRSADQTGGLRHQALFVHWHTPATHAEDRDGGQQSAAVRRSATPGARGDQWLHKA